ncbi:MAG: assimilatory sulfite reductase (NADPH) flavoprotein subunit [Steroidobacteraceae bacterium]
MPAATALPAYSAEPLSGREQRLLAELTTGLDAGALLYISGYAAGLAAAHRQGFVPIASREQAREESHGTRATVLYASHTGNGRRLAERLVADLDARGIAARAVATGSYPLRELASEQLLYLIASTHGDGDPPDDARPFFDFLLGRKAPRLEKLHYAVLALGDSSYPKFCEAGRIADERLAALGACAITARIDCDVDFEAPAAAWAEQATQYALDTARPAGDAAPRLSIVTPLRAAAAPASPAATRDAPVEAAVLARQVITGRASDHPVLHLEIAAPAGSLGYEPGDALGLWPRNPAFLVEQIGEALALDLSATVTHGSEHHTLGEWLAGRREITRLSRPVLEAHAARATHADLRNVVEADAQARTSLLRDWQLIDLLETWPGTWTAEALVAALRPLAPRLYSIASSRDEVGDEVHLTVAAVEYERDGARRVGAASTHLFSETDAPTLRAYIEPNTRFRLPADPDRDIVMIGAGTGIAPYRGFLQARAAAGARGRHWLVFGARRFSTDFLYQSEWLAARKRGLLHRLDLAASRDQAEKVYVQHRLREHGAELWRWIDGGAALYVCGDATRMAPDVHAALRDVVRAHGGRTGEAADEYLAGLVADRRYLRDVY